MGYARGGSSAGSGGKTVINYLPMEMTGNCVTVGRFANRYFKYAQARQATRGLVAGERRGGARAWQINNFGKP